MPVLKRAFARFANGLRNGLGPFLQTGNWPFAKRANARFANSPAPPRSLFKPWPEYLSGGAYTNPQETASVAWDIDTTIARYLRARWLCSIIVDTILDKVVCHCITNLRRTQ